MSNDYFDMLSQNVDDRKEEPKEEQKGAVATLVLRCDADSFALCDGAFIASLKAGQISKAEIQTGQHLIEFQSEEFSKEKIELIVDVPEVGKSYLAIGEGLAEKVNENKEVTKEMMINGWQGTYTGHLKDGKPSGVGTFAYADGRCYKGEFVDGKFKGNGILTWPDGIRYEGEWKDGKRNGKGVQIWADGARYEGEWKNAKMHGKGVITYSNGDKYDGDWKDDLFNGRGVYIWANGSRYEGEWKDGKRNGKGVFINAQGNSYEQVWEDGNLIFGDQKFTVNGVQFTMVAVEGGAFTMGATSEQGSDAYDLEKPAHQVSLNNYCIGQTEVTQALWKAVMGSNPSNNRGDNLPVESVSWNDCQKFIEKLNQLTGRQFRLPTEAEWEYAARGGRKSRGYKYAGSNNLDEVAWYRNNSEVYDDTWDTYDIWNACTHPVAQKLANELGIYDMSGNVYEWCNDWFGEYHSLSESYPLGPSSGIERVRRGGYYDSMDKYCRVSYRSSSEPEKDPDDTFGFHEIGLRLSCDW